jgi:hypothetical protein
MSDEVQLPAERRVPYSQAREYIRDGDVILLRGNAELSRVISDISHSAYSHAGLVLTWYGRRMMLSAEMPKVQAIPLSIVLAKYNGRIDWYKLTPEARARLDLQRLALEALVHLGIEYGTEKLFQLASHFILGTETDDDNANPTTIICSQYISRCFRLAGMDLSPQSDLATVPGEIAVSPFLCYEATLQKEFETVDEVRFQREI